ncbi:MAG: hypothetical protein EOP86_27485 [Verrucomicrobiaceae bacterium]|nr:MAG: hypothetical protein EOP86_27485 [Verrucomicrobiaceae bacterium]
MKPQIYTIRPAVFAPVMLSLTATGMAVHQSWWFLAAVPFIWLGSVCAQPNLNLVNGCLAYLAMIAGGLIMGWFRWLGLIVFAGTMSGYLLSSVEKRLRMRPLPGA